MLPGNWPARRHVGTPGQGTARRQPPAAAARMPYRELDWPVALSVGTGRAGGAPKLWIYRRDGQGRTLLPAHSRRVCRAIVHGCDFHLSTQLAAA
jgi:hypothetical protein